MEQSSGHSIRKSQRGQIVVEYVLLLVVGLSVAMLVTSTMVSRSPDSPGVLVSKWVAIIELIGSDTSDDLKDQDPAAP